MKNRKVYLTMMIFLCLVLPIVLPWLNLLFLDNLFLDHRNVWPQSWNDVIVLINGSIVFALFGVMLIYGMDIAGGNQMKYRNFKMHPVRNRYIRYSSGITVFFGILAVIFMIGRLQSIGFNNGSYELPPKAAFVDRLVGLSIFLITFHFVLDWSKFEVPEGSIVIRNRDNKILYPGTEYSIWPWTLGKYSIVSGEMPIFIDKLELVFADGIKVTGGNIPISIGIRDMEVMQTDALLISPEFLREKAKTFVIDKLIAQSKDVAFAEFWMKVRKQIAEGNWLEGWVLPITCKEYPTLIIAV